jgi:hypothetical protein
MVRSEMTMGETWFRTREHAREWEARHVLVEGTWEFIYNTWEDGIRHHGPGSYAHPPENIPSRNREESNPGPHEYSRTVVRRLGHI